MADTEPTRDWLVTFARKVAEERDYCARHPGHSFTVMLNRDESDGLLEQVRELIDEASVAADLARRRGE